MCFLHKGLRTTHSLIGHLLPFFDSAPAPGQHTAQTATMPTRHSTGGEPYPASPSPPREAEGPPGPADGPDPCEGSREATDDGAAPGDKRTRVELNRAAQQRFRERRKVRSMRRGR